MNLKEMKYTKQDITKGTVEIHYNNETTVCEMFMDDEGDIGFIYGNKEIYLNQITRL